MSRVPLRLFSLRPSEKVHVLLLHECYPRSEYYAKQVISKEAKVFYNLPRKFNLNIPSFFVPKKIGQCMEAYGKHGDIQEKVLVPLSEEVGASVRRIMPEISSLSVSCASPYESPTIEDSIKHVFRSGISHLIIMPLQPQFSCSRSGFLINETVRCVESLTVADEKNENERVLLFSPTSARVSVIDRWSTHPLIANMWSSRLEELKDEVDGVVFVAPILRGYGRREYERSVYASAERVISETRIPLPWKLAFFNSWNQWDLPVMENFSFHAKRLKGKRIVVVPIASVVPTLDTMWTLPQLVRAREGAVLLSPRPDALVVHGLAEIVRNHLLGRRGAQLQHKCTGCFRKDCDTTRSLLK